MLQKRLSGLTVCGRWIGDPARSVLEIERRVPGRKGGIRDEVPIVVRRAVFEELNGRADASALWASRLAARYPIAAMLLLRARAKALVEMSGSLEADGVSQMLDEAQSLAAEATAEDGILSHPLYFEELRVPALRLSRSIRR